MRLKDRLAGSRVLLTGVTGFVGEALLHLHAHRGARTCMSRCWCGPRATLSGHGPDRRAAGEADLRRGRRGAPAASRRCWRPGRGASRATWPTCPTLPADLDAVVHCAGDVSFDPPVDEGVHHQRRRHPRPARPDRRGARPPAGRPLRPHLHGVRRGPPARRASPRRRSTTTSTCEAELRAGGWRSASGSRTAPAAREVLAQAPRRRPRRSTAAPGCSPPPPRPRRRRTRVGQGRAGPDRHRAGPQPRLDRLLHVHQGAWASGSSRR